MRRGLPTSLGFSGVVVALCWTALLLDTCVAHGLESLDAPAIEAEFHREVASRELAKAAKAVDAARAEATAAKATLDQFVAEHFNELRVHLADPLPEPARSTVLPKAPSDPRIERLRQQIRDLEARREELLQTLTAAHPEVVDVEGRLADVARRLESLAGAAEEVRTGEAVTERSPAGSDAAPEAQRQKVQLAIRQYDQYLEHWQAAERTLQREVEREESAQRRLDSLAQAPPRRPAAPPAEVATPPSAVPAPSAPQGAPLAVVEIQHTSQPLALAALLIALAVAALAAVKLARASGEAVFSSIDDVAAALALPVIGVIPAAPAAAGGKAWQFRLRRFSTFAAQMLGAISIFAVVAYCVQNPQSVWDACMHPLESLGRARDLLGP